MSDVVRLTVAQALVRWLAVQHSERDGVRQRAVPAMFGIFGHGNVLSLGPALAEARDAVPFHQPKNEQAMVHTAIGFAKAARRMQTLACTASIGPGATNMLTGAATATVNRLPVLLFPADTFATRRSGVVLQQLEHPLAGDVSVNDAFRPVSRYFDRIARSEQLLTALPSAMRVLLDPAATGAVTVALHQDVLAEEAGFPRAFFEPRTWIVSRRPPAADELAAAAALLRTARRPLIIAGGGVRYAAAEQALAALVEATGVPVVETSAGKGVAGDHPCALGGIGVNGTRAANEVAARADVVLAVGTRLTDFTTASQTLFDRPDVRLVGVNVDSGDANKTGGVPLTCDARLGLEALRGIVPPVADAYRQEVTRARQMWARDLAADLAATHEDGMTQGEVYSVVNASMRAGDWVVAAAGWSPGDVLKAWQLPPGAQAHVEFGFSCMGHEIPAGLGIRMRHGDDGEVIVVIGDGTYLMGASELLTCVQEQRKLTVVILDNGGYGSIDALARDRVGVSLGNRFAHADDERRLLVDFGANAESFGCRGVRADTSEELIAALEEARESVRTTVIHCPTVPGRPLLDAGVAWDLGVPARASV